VECSDFDILLSWHYPGLTWINQKYFQGVRSSGHDVLVHVKIWSWKR